jgi:putative membrane protein insertion efficiency factor
MMVRKILLAPLGFYQKYLTILGFGSCRYYPTCSEYAKWQLATNPSLVKALGSSIMRILRCNQLFDGGIDYPEISCNHFHATSPSSKIPGIVFWFVPEGKRCKVVKNIFSKGPTC